LTIKISSYILKWLRCYKASNYFILEGGSILAWGNNQKNDC